MRSARDLSKEAISIVGEAIEKYQPRVLYGMFSGGHDSRCAVHVASLFKIFAGCVHINTGIGVEETRDYVRQTCAENGWPLREMRSPISYESLVRKYGFPGPASHQMMYTRLKERCVRQLVRESKIGKYDRILLVAGIRQSESTRRKFREPHQREFCRVWASPLIYWTTEERNQFMHERGFRPNPVVGKLCMSGECLCGAFAKPGERAEIAAAYPAADAEISRLEKIAAECGVPCKWGTRPPKKEKATTDYDADLFSLCWSCSNQRAP